MKIPPIGVIYVYDDFRSVNPIKDDPIAIKIFWFPCRSRVPYINYGHKPCTFLANCPTVSICCANFDNVLSLYLPRDLHTVSSSRLIWQCLHCPSRNLGNGVRFKLYGNWALYGFISFVPSWYCSTDFLNIYFGF